MNNTPSAECEGPLIWYSVEDVIPGVIDCAGILRCNQPECGYIIVTTNLHDQAHANTPVLPEGLAA